MYKVFILSLLILAQSIPAFCAKPFEGKVFMTVKSEQFEGKMELSIAKEGFRADLTMSSKHQPEPTKTSYIAYNDDTKPSYVLMHNTKTMAEINPNQAKKLQKFYAKSENFEVKKLGRKKVNGYRCEHVQLSSEKQTLDLWLTKDILDFQTFEEIQQNTLRLSNANMTEILKKEGLKGFPIKIVQASKMGNSISTEVDRVKKQSLPESVFELPKSYTLAQKANY